MKALGTFAVAVALIAMMACCAPAHASTQYTLTIFSTEGGNITTPGEGTFTYDEGTEVYLMAEAQEGYSFINWTGDVDTVNVVNAAWTTITMEDNCSITANFAFWDIDITNKDDQCDYPACVQAGGTYNVTVKLRVNVPVGKTCGVLVNVDTRIASDPPDYRLCWLNPSPQQYWTRFGNGTHATECSFNFSTPDVIRESRANIKVTAELSGGDLGRDRDYQYRNLTILPSKESAVDVEFTGTVVSLDVFWGKVVVGANISIDEVTVQDPWSLLTPGEAIYVGFEDGPFVEDVWIGVGDKVEVCCDYHCDEGGFALIWRAGHHITRLQTFLWVWVLVGLVVTGVPVYFLWWRRRSGSVRDAQ